MFYLNSLIAFETDDYFFFDRPRSRAQEDLMANFCQNALEWVLFYIIRELKPAYHDDNGNENVNKQKCYGGYRLLSFHRTDSARVSPWREFFLILAQNVLNF